MIEFILAILSFISSFIPYFGFIISIILAIITIILSKYNLKNKNNFKKGEIYIISVVVSIVAIIVSTIIGVYTYFSYNDNTNNKNMFSNSVIDTYDCFSMGDNINVNNVLEVKINSISKENNYIANITFKALEDNVSLSKHIFHSIMMILYL